LGALHLLGGDPMYFVLFAVLMVLFLVRLGDVVRGKGYSPWPARIFSAMLLCIAFFGGSAIARSSITAYTNRRGIDNMDHPVFLMMFIIPVVTMILAALVIWFTALRLPSVASKN